MKKDKIIVIAGPTASGKSDIAVELAEKINGEIISADSMQIYKYMDIGSAKITKDEMRNINHYMIDIVDPGKEFSVADYKNLGEKCIKEILSKGKTPIIAGGTGLYINALTCNMNYAESKKDEDYRAYLDNLANENGNEYIHKMLREIDLISYNNIHYNNRKRVIRALEVYKLTKKPFSSYNLGEDLYKSDYEINYFVLNMDRENLYNRINKRVDIMINKGLVDECISLKNMGYTKEMQSMQGIGYKEILSYLDSEISYQDSINIIKQGSRNYAKRQITWFKKDKRAIFLDKDKLSNEEIISLILKKLIL